MKMITEEEIRKIVREELSKYLVGEGIDVWPEKYELAFNPNHQNYIDTNDPWNPQPIYSTVRGYKVISIFSRKMSKDKLDGNPLIYALKGKDWKFKHPQYDIFALLRRFVAVTKELKDTYDTIITIPSSNSLNVEILHKVSKLIPHSYEYEDFFTKYTVDDVYESFIDSEWLDRAYKDNPTEKKKMHGRLYAAFEKMCSLNNRIFSYKYIKPIELRNAINQSMKVSDKYTDEFSVSDQINGKKVLIIDDTVTSGKTLSDSADAIMEMYDPKSITFLTLFSPLTKQ